MSAKHFGAFTVVSVLVFLVVAAGTVSAQTSSSDILKRLGEDISQANGFIALNDNESTDLNVLSNSASNLSVRLNESASLYKKLNNENGNTLSSIATELSNIASNMADAIKNRDSSAYSRELGSYNATIDRFNNAINNYQSAEGVTDYGGVLGFSVLISVGISIILLSQSLIGNKLFRAEQIRNKYQFDLFKASLFPLIGSVVTYVWFLATPAGGTYYVLWGPILFGYLAFLSKLYTYMTDTRPKINHMKKTELAKLHNIMRS